MIFLLARAKASNLTMEVEMSLTEPNHRMLSVVYQDVSTLKPRATNPRTHSKKQITQLANAIRRFGFTNPALVDDANGIIAGHGRVEAAKIVGLDQVPTVRLSDMSEAEIRAYVIADNRLAENAGWDRAQSAVTDARIASGMFKTTTSELRQSRRNSKTMRPVSTAPRAPSTNSPWMARVT